MPISVSRQKASSAACLRLGTRPTSHPNLDQPAAPHRPPRSSVRGRSCASREPSVRLSGRVDGIGNSRTRRRHTRKARSKNASTRGGSISPLTVRGGLNRRGGWEIALPDERGRVTRETLDEARRVGYLCAARGIAASWSCATPTIASGEDRAEAGSLADVDFVLSGAAPPACRAVGVMSALRGRESVVLHIVGA
jgi:hypothetical protein